MEVEALKNLPKIDVLNFIRERLKFDSEVLDSLRCLDQSGSTIRDKEHKRFNMSGYESKKGGCTVWNMSILNEFADLGIYDYTKYLFLDFYKGGASLYLQYFYGDEDRLFDLTGLGTTDIIYRVFELTIFSEEAKRRRI